MFWFGFQTWGPEVMECAGGHGNGSKPGLDGDTRTAFLQPLPWNLLPFSWDLLWGYCEMFSDKQFSVPNNVRFSFTVAIGKESKDWISYDLFKLIKELGMGSNVIVFELSWGPFWRRCPPSQSHQQWVRSSIWPQDSNFVWRGRNLILPKLKKTAKCTKKQHDLKCL